MNSPHGASRSYEEKEIKGKRFMKSGKTNDRVSHVPQFSPSYNHIPKWSSLIIDTHKIHRVYGLWFRVWGLWFILINT